MTGNAAPAEDLLLYRAVGPEEVADCLAIRRLRPGPSSVEGKHLATTAAHAERWGAMLYAQRGYSVLKVRVSPVVRKRLHYFRRLDNIGPAYFAPEDVLDRLTIVHYGPTMESAHG